MKRDIFQQVEASHRRLTFILVTLSVVVILSFSGYYVTAGLAVREVVNTRLDRACVERPAPWAGVALWPLTLATSAGLKSRC